MADAKHRVVVVGGGFGGLRTVQNLNKVDVDVTLIDRRNFHLFQPLLYQVATGSLSPANIASPLRAIVKKQKNVRVILDEVTGLDVPGKAVLLGEQRVPYDTLVLATGSHHHYFGHPEWERYAPGLKTIEDATEIRRRILTAFEDAECETDPLLRTGKLTFVIVGGGPTGVEMAGSIGDLSRTTLSKDFRNIDPTTAKIILIEGSTRVLPTFPESLSASALKALNRMGVEVILDAHVIDIRADHVLYKPDGGQGEPKKIETHTVVWAAGVKASPLGKMIADATGAQSDRAGRVIVQPDLTIPNHPNIFVIGDLAAAKFPDGKTQLPGVAPVAMQQGKYVARVIWKRLVGRGFESFRYWDKGSMATIGRAAAVVDLYWLRFSGFIAWTAWLFIHVMYLIAFQNRLQVMGQWAWSYFTRNRAARLITKTFSEQLLEEKSLNVDTRLTPTPPIR